MNINTSKLKNYFGLGVFFIVLIFIDQITKNSVGNIFKNYNFTFSLKIPTVLGFVFYALILFSIFRYLRNRYSEISQTEFFSWLLILSGGLSNIIERLLFGFVKDWIYISAFGYTGVYNLADGYIILGVIILIVLELTPKNKIS